MVDGESYHWRDGEGVIFDETLVHSAENLSDQTRLILLCDIERPKPTPWYACPIALLAVRLCGPRPPGMRPENL
jgi:aspartyl/asparaginyl beta-hydroxylase (cupin superfamily)